MNTYRFSDLKTGIQASFSAHVTEKMLDTFMQLSGDNNPLHANTEYAREKKFPNRVVHGLLTAALYSRLVGLELPGQYALLHKIEISFLKPVFPGDTLTVSGEISELDETFRQIHVKAQIINQNNEKVSRAKIWVGFHE